MNVNDLIEMFNGYKSTIILTEIIIRKNDKKRIGNFEESEWCPTKFITANHETKVEQLSQEGKFKLMKLSNGMQLQFLKVKILVTI